MKIVAEFSISFSFSVTYCAAFVCMCTPTFMCQQTHKEAASFCQLAAALSFAFCPVLAILLNDANDGIVCHETAGHVSSYFEELLQD